MAQSPRSTWQQYLLAAAALVSATILRLTLDPALGNHLPYVTYFMAVAFVGWFCGLGPSIFALLAGSYLSEFLFFPPRYVAFPYNLTAQGVFGTLSYFMVTGWITFVCVTMHRTRRLAAREQSALGELERRFKLFIEQVTDYAIFTTDPEGRPTTWNEGVKRVFGFNEDEFLGRDIATTIFTPEDQAAGVPRQELAIAAATGAANNDRWMMRKDGTRFYAIGVTTSQLDSSGRLVGFAKIARDQTERKRAEDALRDSETRKASILASALDPIITMDQEGRVVDFNPAAEQTFGYRRADAVGRYLADLIIPPRLRDAHWAGLRGFMSTGEGRIIGRRIEMPAMRANGEEFPVELAVNVVRLEGRAPLFTGYLRDITERRRAEQAAARLAAIVTSSEDAIISKDLDGTITSWNRGAERLFGYTPDEAVGRPVTMLIPRDHLGEEPKILERIRGGEAVEHFETVRRHKDGRLIDISLTVSPICDGGGRIIGASKIARDISARKLAERRLRDALAESERIARMKDEFLATLSHELRTPMTAIHGWARLLSQGVPEADVRQGIEVIERNARLQSQIIEDLLDMSRIISGKIRLDVQSVRLHEIINAAVDAIRPAANAKGVRLQSVCDPGISEVRGDPTRLQQVVYNLLTNAVKFTPKEGRVQVVCQRVNSHVEISVSDTGVGITREFLPHVFERFRQQDASTTRRYQGLGLGLAIVKHIVELHGGTVQAGSEGEGRGATFTVHLPVSIALAPKPPLSWGDEQARVHPASGKGRSAPAPGGKALEGLSVLVVDDEADARELIGKMLEQRGARVLLAGSGEQALDRLPRHRPDLLVCDIGMPGMDGYKLIGRVRSLTPEQGGATPALALTAFARSEDRTRSLLAGFQIHLSKPVEPDELVASIMSLSGRARS